MNEKELEFELYEELGAKLSPGFPLEQAAYEDWIDEKSLAHITDEELLEEMSEKFLSKELYCNEHEKYSEYYEHNCWGLDIDEMLINEEYIY